MLHWLYGLYLKIGKSEEMGYTLVIEPWLWDKLMRQFGYKKCVKVDAVFRETERAYKIMLGATELHTRFVWVAKSQTFWKEAADESEITQICNDFVAVIEYRNYLRDLNYAVCY